MSCRAVPLYLGRNAFSTHFTKVAVYSTGVSSHSAHFFIFSNQPDMRKSLHQLWDSLLTFQNSQRIKRLKDKLLLKLLIVGSACIHYSCFSWFAREDMRTLFKIKCFDFICFKQRSVFSSWCGKHSCNKASCARPRNDIKVVGNPCIFSIQCLLNWVVVRTYSS